MYERKTKDVYFLMSNYGYGWECETQEETKQAALQTLKEYRENSSGHFYIKKMRVAK